jgi:hypothetical protein
VLVLVLASGPRFDLLLAEFTFSNVKPALNLAMKLSALVITSGLGQNNAVAAESDPLAAATGLD